MSPELPELLTALMLLPSKINGAVQVLDLKRNVRPLPLSRVFRGFTAQIRGPLVASKARLVTEEICLSFQEGRAKASPR